MVVNNPLQMKFGLVGHPLGHSFSAAYFKEKFNREGINACYLNFDLEDASQVPALFDQHPNLRGLNVTIPYKRAIIPYLHSLNPDAEAIGAVNVIKPEFSNGEQRLIGYNSDHIGFRDSLTPYYGQHKSALILGTGGASQAVCHALKNCGIKFLFVSRTPGKAKVSYQNLNRRIMDMYTMIINTTPLGMYPKTDECPDIPYDLLTPRHLLYDLTYNPEETLFLRRGREHGASTMNGLKMLHLQAEAAWKIWQGFHPSF